MTGIQKLFEIFKQLYIKSGESVEVLDWQKFFVEAYDIESSAVVSFFSGMAEVDIEPFSEIKLPRNLYQHLIAELYNAFYVSQLIDLNLSLYKSKENIREAAKLAMILGFQAWKIKGNIPNILIAGPCTNVPASLPTKIEDGAGHMIFIETRFVERIK